MAVATALTVFAIASAGFSAYQQIRAGKAQKEAGKAERAASDAQAELAEYNAEVANLQAQDAIERGGDEENRFRSMVRGAIGAQRAGFAAGNIAVGFGSAVDVQADAAFLGELDALQIRQNAAREAWGFKVEATDLRRRADIARKEGVYLEKAGNERAKQSYIGAGASLVSAGASLLEQRYFGRSTSSSA
jgi:hypothetical protein